MGVAQDYRGPSGKTMPGTTLDAESLVARLRSLFAQKEGVLLAYLFGSYASCEARKDSDVDIAILCEAGCTGEALLSLYRELFLGIRKSLGTERFDLFLLNRAPLLLQFEVVAHGRLVYARDWEVLNDFKMKTIARYQDTNYLRDVQNQYLKERACQWYGKAKESAPD
jgi:predicted nucleotidyltransferase